MSRTWSPRVSNRLLLDQRVRGRGQGDAIAPGQRDRVVVNPDRVRRGVGVVVAADVDAVAEDLADAISGHLDERAAPDPDPHLILAGVGRHDGRRVLIAPDEREVPDGDVAVLAEHRALAIQVDRATEPGLAGVRDPDRGAVAVEDQVVAVLQDEAPRVESIGAALAEDDRRAVGHGRDELVERLGHVGRPGGVDRGGHIEGRGGLRRWKRAGGGGGCGRSPTAPR